VLSELLMMWLQLCCYLRAATDQHRRRAANNGERVAPAAPKNSPLMGPLYPFHDSRDKSRLDKCETNDRRGTRVGDRGRAVSPPIDSIHRFRHPNTNPNVCGVGMKSKKIQINL